jgi:hypothetical protein
VRAPTSLPPPPRWLTLACAAGLAAAALWLRLYRLDALSFWNDEVASVTYARLPPGELWGADNHPPLYYLLLHYWQLWAGDDGWRLRLLSLLFSLATLPAVWLIGRRIGGPWLAIAATCVIAFGAFDLRYAQELRMYSLLCCAAAWALAGFGALLADPPRAAQRASAGDWALLGLGTLVALYTHTLALLLPMTATLLAVLLWWRRPERRRLARNFILVYGLVLLAWLPFVPELLRQSGLSSWQWIEAPDLSDIAYIQLQLAFGLPYITGPLPAAGLVGFLALTFLGWRSLPSTWRLALPVLALLPPVTAILLSWLYRPVYLARPLIWTEIPVAVLVGAGAVAVLSARPRRWLAVGVLLVLMTMAGNGYSLWYHYKVFGKADWRNVAATTLSLSEPGDVVLVPHGDHQALAYYLQRAPEGTGREPPPVLGLWHRTVVQVLAMVGTMPAAPHFLVIEIGWMKDPPLLNLALRVRFPCHAVTRAGERSGMVVWRYALRENCAR